VWFVAPAVAPRINHYEPIALSQSLDGSDGVVYLRRYEPPMHEDQRWAGSLNSIVDTNVAVIRKRQTPSQFLPFGFDFAKAECSQSAPITERLHFAQICLF